MTIQLGSLMLIKIWHEEKGYMTIGGLKSTRMVLNNKTIDVTTKLSENWRELISGSIRSMSLSGGGIFTGSESENIIRNLSFSGEKQMYQICFGSGEIFEGAFIISSYERTGNYDDEETYNITLESASKIELKTNEK